MINLGAAKSFFRDAEGAAGHFVDDLPIIGHGSDDVEEAEAGLRHSTAMHALMIGGVGLGVGAVAVTQMRRGQGGPGTRRVS